jgi:aspartate racemase
MKTAGLIGGLGPESTVDYYQSIIKLYRERKPDGSYPSLIINSIDVEKARKLIESDQLAELARYLSAEVNRLAAAGADFAVITANTPHLVFDDVQRQSALPLISIVQATCDAARALGLKKLALLGTRFTMQGHFYSDVFSAAQIALVVPGESEQAFIHEKYIGELLIGSFLPETRQRILDVAVRMTAEEGVEAVVLAGTELPLLLRDAGGHGIRFLDTTQIHVNAVVDNLLS